MLLDVLFEPAPAAAPTLIQTTFIQTTRPVHVPMPDVNGLLGDKLTAFAPRTIGILQHPARAGDMVKQLFDVAVLFDFATDLGAVAAAYEAVHALQCRYRKPYSLDETLDDTITACLALSRGWNQLKEQPENDPIGEFLTSGVRNLQNHIVNAPFGRDQSQVAAGKAACVAAWVKRRPQGAPIESLRYNPGRISELRTATIQSPWTSLQRLRGPNPEAFFYWWRAQQLLSAEPTRKKSRSQIKKKRKKKRKKKKGRQSQGAKKKPGI